ncbi:uncharacterized protein ASCRUDRAFT_9687 [Ascoidea rubescens DSM 1968]|uniref:Rad60/SUMO-like domain-containing protein n=1 Tax=Ascoidea rubescens DSM 1968 TaxID=1344418 RepID=A0A1D2VCE5_9ASCO|nr:hypothetical protein ASCRUDRAFT_9687 [Ascoidea rubescens DSM 1968]ODV59295.1 hypothetical protein ASCRUDRAFT_9687 [Ascoidea rubescens DSM 1968]
MSSDTSIVIGCLLETSINDLAKDKPTFFKARLHFKLSSIIKSYSKFLKINQKFLTFYHNGKELNKNKTMSFYNFQNNTTLHVKLLDSLTSIKFIINTNEIDTINSTQLIREFSFYNNSLTKFSDIIHDFMSDISFQKVYQLNSSAYQFSHKSKDIFQVIERNQYDSSLRAFGLNENPTIYIKTEKNLILQLLASLNKIPLSKLYKTLDIPFDPHNLSQKKNTNNNSNDNNNKNHNKENTELINQKNKEIEKLSKERDKLNLKVDDLNLKLSLDEKTVSQNIEIAENFENFKSLLDSQIDEHNLNIDEKYVSALNYFNPGDSAKLDLLTLRKLKSILFYYQNILKTKSTEIERLSTDVEFYNKKLEFKEKKVTSLNESLKKLEKIKQESIKNDLSVKDYQKFLILLTEMIDKTLKSIKSSPKLLLIFNEYDFNSILSENTSKLSLQTRKNTQKIKSNDEQLEVCFTNLFIILDFYDKIVSDSTNKLIISNEANIQLENRLKTSISENNKLQTEIQTLTNFKKHSTEQQEKQKNELEELKSKLKNLSAKNIELGKENNNRKTELLNLQNVSSIKDSLLNNVLTKFDTKIPDDKSLMDKSLFQKIEKEIFEKINLQFEKVVDRYSSKLSLLEKENTSSKDKYDKLSKEYDSNLELYEQIMKQNESLNEKINILEKEKIERERLSSSNIVEDNKQDMERLKELSEWFHKGGILFDELNHNDTSTQQLSIPIKNSTSEPLEEPKSKRQKIGNGLNNSGNLLDTNSTMIEGNPTNPYLNITVKFVSRNDQAEIPTSTFKIRYKTKLVKLMKAFKTRIEKSVDYKAANISVKNLKFEINNVRNLDYNLSIDSFGLKDGCEILSMDS